MIKRFEEKSVLITGASRGIGKGIAKRFADEGASLILAANDHVVSSRQLTSNEAGRQNVRSTFFELFFAIICLTAKHTSPILR
jgi:NAD(P)-dependent dehydrogenase (short-subunit alcohol dehydrogenase family)